MSKKLKDIDTDEELWETFLVFDRDGDQRILPEELSHVMKVFGQELTEKEVDDLVNEADTDGKGYISYEDFVRMMRLR
eukprot:CAMPEP_0202958114 /NCGR_PEP_ID=MMETSP1396-20130829/2466_1 /ASSEMBLY_ACC=CAM_ASM_000872 /TAXON_ID= /ORGANISM="Pseudokeronopsis sp., Strain Brazil" /LENGTH=77 /DNA_ID=CAMNT_0049675979 /DNA_START=216 /DNA_END=449 /DNA_ORIENTATION=-